MQHKPHTLHYHAIVESDARGEDGPCMRAGRKVDGNECLNRCVDLVWC